MTVLWCHAHTPYFRKMKIPLTIIALLSFTLSSTGQTVSLARLIEKSLCEDFDCFNSLMVNNGFFFEEQKGNKYDFQSVEYVDGQLDFKSKNFASIQFYHLHQEDAEVITSVMTANSDYHDALVSEMDEGQFVATASETDEDGALSVSFTSDNYPALQLVVTARFPTYEGETYIVYNFAILRKIIYTKAPALTLAELMDKTQCTDLACYRNFMSSRGYVFYETDGNEHKFKSELFAATELENIATFNRSYIEFYEEYGEVVTGLITPTPHHVAAILSELEEMKFVLLDEVTTDSEDVEQTFTSPLFPDFDIVVSTWQVPFEELSYLVHDFMIIRYKE